MPRRFRRGYRDSFSRLPIAVQRKMKAEEETRRRHRIARYMAKTPEERQIEDEMNEALGQVRAKLHAEGVSFDNYDVLSLIADRENVIKAEAERKLAALPPEKRSDGTYDVNTFDFEAYDKAEREERQARWEEYLNKLFPPAKERSGNASRS